MNIDNSLNSIWNEEEKFLPVPISALQHYSYCPRQCALIHQEQEFTDNVHTARGQAVHKVVDIPKSDITKGIRVERALPLYSKKLGLTGKADLVEFASKVPYPVEYKHGNKRTKQHDDIQLTAQAICLEEMLNVTIPKGAIYYYRSRHRREVEFTEELRNKVVDLTKSVRLLMVDKILPYPANDYRCRECSLAEICQPQIITKNTKLSVLFNSLFTYDEL